MTDTINLSLNNLSKTMLITLYARAIESQSANPILIDDKSVEIVNKLNPLLSSDDPFYLNLINGKIPKSCITITALRSKLLDEYVTNFLKKEPTGIVVEIGCGLGTRFFRTNNNQMDWYDLDLPEIIKLKKQFIQENDRYHFISSSVFDLKWMDSLAKKKNHSFLFIAEGVFIYLYENDIKELFLKLQKSFPGCEIVFDVNNSHLVKWIQKIHHIFFKTPLKDERYYGDYFKRETPFKWGIKNEKEIEKWNQGIKFIDERIYFDYKINETWFLKPLSYFKFYRKSRYIVHYKLN